MTTTTQTAPHRRTLPRWMAYLGIAYTFAVTMLGTTLPTPLYPIYEHEYRFGNLMTTIIYAAYAAGVLAALLLIGRASDTVGRRPLLLMGVAASIASAIVFVTDAGLPALFAGRVLSGISAGIFTGTATVALVELAAPGRQREASILASAVNMLGLGCGPLLAGVLAAWAPAPLHLPYLADMALMIPAGLVVWFAPETVTGSTGSWPRPRRPRVPAQAVAVFVPAAIAAFAAFAVFGLLTATEPAVLAQLLHRTSPALAGVVVFAMFAGSAAGQVGITPRLGRLALALGCGVLIAGLVGIAVSLVTESLPLLIAGTVVVGVGQGITFSSGIAEVAAASPADRRAETVSAFFVVAYVAISIPVVLVGVGSATIGLRSAGIVFTVAVAVLTAVALAAVLRLAHRDARHGGG